MSAPLPEPLFTLAALAGREGLLARTSAPQARLLEEMADRRLAIVGNARALAETDQGAAIDAADLVIRVNRAPMPAARSHGSRCDWLALAVRLDTATAARLAPRRLLWMSHKRKRLGRAVAAHPGFHLHPRADWARLAAELGAPPTTGLMLIDLAARSRAARIDLHGFDFFASRSLSGRRGAAEVPHDFAAESAWTHALAARDPRLVLHRLSPA